MSLDHANENQPQDTNNYGTAEDLKLVARNDPLFRDIAMKAIQRFDVHTKVANLRKDVLEIGEYFNDIYRFLCHWDRRIHKQRSKILPSLFSTTAPANLRHQCLTTWDKIRKDYQALVWQSRELATTVANRAGQFRTDMIPLLHDTNLPFSDKKRELGEFLEDMKETDQSARELSQGFIDIPTRIRDFQSYYGTEAARWGTITKDKSGVDKRIQDLNTQIERLVEKLEKYQSQQEMAWRTLRAGISIESCKLGDVFFIAIGAFLGMAGRESLMSNAVSQSGVLSEMKAKTILVKTQVELSYTRAQLDDKQSRLRALQTDAENLQLIIPGYIKYTGVGTGDICERLNAIAKFWAVVRTDAQILHEQMKKAGNASEQRFYSLLLERQKIVPLYEKIEAILIDYADAVA